MQKKIFILILGLEFIIGIYLGVGIYNKSRENVLGTLISVNPIKKESVVFTPVDGLKNFYEPVSNTLFLGAQDIQAKLNLNYEPVITINSDRLNERFEYTEEKPKDTFRIVTLGDSFTFGVYVNTKDNYPEQLEELLNSKLTCKNIKKFEVINLGMGGYDIQYAVERYKLRGEKYNPDLVLWLLKDDDFFQIYELFKDKVDFYHNEMKESGELDDSRLRGIYYPHYAKASEDLNKELGKEKILNLQKNYLRSISNFYKEKLLVLAFPWVSNNYKDVMREFVQERKSSYYYDGLPALEEKEERLEDHHPTIKGYSLIAKNLFEYLIKSKLISCN